MRVHEGFWATVTKNGGSIEKVIWASNEAQATEILMHITSPLMRLMVTVEPVKVEVIQAQEPETADRA